MEISIFQKIEANANWRQLRLAVLWRCKEQSSGLYAQTLAEQGFVTLAFDPSYTGESGGIPRNVASPDINTEDFSAAVDFLGLQKKWIAIASAYLVSAVGAGWR